MHYILGWNWVHLVRKLCWLLLLLCQYLLKHLILLTQVVLMLSRLNLLLSRRILNRVALSLRHTLFLRWGYCYSTAFLLCLSRRWNHSWRDFLGLRLLKSLRTPILLQFDRLVSRVFDKINRNVSWSRWLPNRFLGNNLLFSLINLPWCCQLRFCFLMVNHTTGNRNGSNRMLRRNRRIGSLSSIRCLGLLQSSGLCSQYLLFHQVRIWSIVMIMTAS